jgi:hypothetical protein
MNSVRPSTATAEPTLADAHQALDDLRSFVKSRTSLKVEDKKYALQFQLESLEDMLRVVTDSRYAQSLGEPGVMAGHNKGAGVETLQYIVSAARDITGMEPTKAGLPPIGTDIWIRRSIEPLQLRITPSRTNFRSARTEEGHDSALHTPNLAGPSSATLRSAPMHIPPKF